MKFKIVAKTFNGTDIQPEVEIFVNLGKKNNTLSTMVYSEIENKIENEFGNKISFYVISKDLETLKSRDIQIDTTSLVEKIYPLVVDLIKTNKVQNPLKNQQLLRVIQFYNDKNIDSANEILNDMDINSLSKLDRDEYIFLRFKLLKDKQESDFEQAREIFKNNPIKVKQIYFDFIKYLEDNRDEKRPQKLLQEFEKNYPKSILSKDELAIYYYLKGRANYARGEFLEALKHLSLSLENRDKEDRRLTASIYNTATNCFTDNLFLDEAKELAEKALVIRKELKLIEENETISLLGGISFKNTKFKKAYKYYSGSKNINARGYNYLAKTSLMLGYDNKAYEYIEKSSKFEDKKGFLVLIKLLRLYQQQKYSDLLELYKKTIFLKENKRIYDKFVIGWGYTLMARASFEQQKYEDGVEYLYRGLDYFIEDNYILEAFYVHLYLYQYSLPVENLNEFDELTNKLSIIEKFENYVVKHLDISSNYSKVFGIKESKKNNLKKFYKNTKYINRDNYNPKVVKDILDTFCLI